MVTSNLGREDWMRAARRALLVGGPDAVRVEPLASALGVTKGSFYWHFPDRPALLDALLSEWEEERSIALAELPLLQGPAAIRAVMEFLKPRIASSERGEIPSDAAIFTWAATDPVVARRVNTAESERVELMRELVGDRDLGEFLYLTYLGFVMRRRRMPGTSAFFTTLAQLAEQVADGAPTKRTERVKAAARTATVDKRSSDAGKRRAR